MKSGLSCPYLLIQLLVILATSSHLPGQDASPTSSNIKSASGEKLILTDFYPGLLPPSSGLAAIPDLASLKIDSGEVGSSYRYFHNNFDLVREQGIDGIIYVTDGKPIPAALPVALKDAQIKATLLLDLNTLHPLSSRKVPSEIRRYTQSLAAAAMELFNSLPRECRALDTYGRLPIFVRGFPADSARRGAGHFLCGFD